MYHVCDYPYYSCLVTLWHCHPYFMLQFYANVFQARVRWHHEVCAILQSVLGRHAYVTCQHQDIHKKYVCSKQKQTKSVSNSICHQYPDLDNKITTLCKRKPSVTRSMRSFTSIRSIYIQERSQKKYLVGPGPLDKSQQH